MPGFRRFSVAEYHKLIEFGVLTENDQLELLDGYLVEKMPHDPICTFRELVGGEVRVFGSE